MGAPQLTFRVPELAEYSYPKGKHFNQISPESVITTSSRPQPCLAHPSQPPVATDPAPSVQFGLRAHAITPFFAT